MKHPNGNSLRPRRRFGQHFLHDRNVIGRIINAIDLSGHMTLVEIGPGHGALTFPLLNQVDRLHVIEIDVDLAGVLQRNADQDSKLIVHQSDALKFDFCHEIAGPLYIIGNLPYNISTPLLFHLLNQSSCIVQMVIMLQKEVAERICAAPGSRAYGRLSIMVQAVCDTDPLFTVAAGAFTPPPKVESAVIRLTPRAVPKYNIHDHRVFSEVVRTAFSYRRKTLRNALKGLVDEQDIVNIDVLPSVRPEQLPVETYVKLANTVYHKRREISPAHDNGDGQG